MPAAVHKTAVISAWHLATFALSIALSISALADDATRPPSAVYGELFQDVQLQRVFRDSKTFPDAVPKTSADAIVSAYRQQRTKPGFDLRTFVTAHFDIPEPTRVDHHHAETADAEVYVDATWGDLVRVPVIPASGSSLLALPKPYVVPGGRFTEIYYWDSYFTMRGLARSGRHDVVRAMLANFVSLVERYGHVPNGNRSYYLSRSQPPFLASMVELVAQREGREVYPEFVDTLRKEHAFWMRGEEGLQPGEADRHVVRLRDGAILNRYWDELEIPRDEAYREDVETARASGRPVNEVYRNLRAAAESGWDFSSRWLADGQSLGTIRTTELVPPDLNSLLYKLESTIQLGCKVTKDLRCARDMEVRAAARKAAIRRHLWNAEVNAFTDYDWRRSESSREVTAATLYPLYVRVSSPQQARSVANTVRARLLASGGLATTERRTDQQWDAPNGWAPLQWIAVSALRNYGASELAKEIALRWVKTNVSVYQQTLTLFEKYDVEQTRAGTGGEYVTQQGFGWTNGVLKDLLALYPSLRTPRDAKQ